MQPMVSSSSSSLPTSIGATEAHGRPPRNSFSVAKVSLEKICNLSDDWLSLHNICCVDKYATCLMIGCLYIKMCCPDKDATCLMIGCLYIKMYCPDKDVTCLMIGGPYINTCCLTNMQPP